ncbi:uncharacterized protein BCR38DRAFT_172484 [Pseudomassariella vexata]|uniref:Uncharacterized protein n=1 Tax=Pseudomassariella vexata TaxID=1141098 RepID=A0A1Y2E3F1_9PEZI|nr:uncharacterized protein BCR38DRAFT_172484 [Pseudomassariella vexata]ORY66073.1 hypothetical protein BCR38DRAFT_172484 [Pseudomassariella vexata]
MDIDFPAHISPFAAYLRLSFAIARVNPGFMISSSHNKTTQHELFFLFKLPFGPHMEQHDNPILEQRGKINSGTFVDGKTTCRDETKHVYEEPSQFSLRNAAEAKVSEISAWNLDLLSESSNLTKLCNCFQLQGYRAQLSMVIRSDSMDRRAEHIWPLNCSMGRSQGISYRGFQMYISSQKLR